MNDNLQGKINLLASKKNNNSYRPIFFNLQLQHDKNALEALLDEDPSIQLSDNISGQLSELIKIRNPQSKLSEAEIKAKIDTHLHNIPFTEYGVWVYYPWNKCLVHLLNKDEFIEARTNRNKYKITGEEQQELRTKKLGVIGMSVGQTVACVLAIESLCSEIRIADFDLLELTNCNRLKTSLTNLGLPKIIIAAREISEIDPFINVVCFDNGITEENIDSFFCEGGKLDLLLEECDSIDIKLLARETAKKFRVPLVMETNDRGMIDIERYDIDKNYLPFHGMLGPITYSHLKHINSRDKIGFIVKIVGAQDASVRSIASFLEIGQTILNFPQLASAVYLGGAICADTVRKILLGQHHSSGRFYVDLDNIIKDNDHEKDKFKPGIPEPISETEMKNLADKHSDKKTSCTISEETANEIILNAIQAPSSENDQPWIWMYRNNSFFLFHNIHRSFSFGDFNNNASYISMGCAIENFELSTRHHSYKPEVLLFPENSDKRLVAKINILPLEKEDSNSNEILFQNISKRHTSRKILPRKILSNDILDILTKETISINNIQIDWVTGESQLMDLGKIISACDRMRLLNPLSHYDFFNREIRWSREEALKNKTGMCIEDLNIPNEMTAALRFLSDYKVAEVLKRINGANAMRYASVPFTMAASAMCLITTPGNSEASYIEGGKALERLWLTATELKIAIQPMHLPLNFFSRLVLGNGGNLDIKMQTELAGLRKIFLDIFPGDNLRGEISLIRIFAPDEDEPKTPRLNLNDVFIFNK